MRGTSAPELPRFAAPHWLAVVIVLMAAGWRWGALASDVRFHVDEALFATFARGAAVHGDWWLSGALDKPPLALYAQALAMHFAGVTFNPLGVHDLAIRTGEFAARLPGALAGVMAVALTLALGRRLAGQAAGLWSAGLVAFAPGLVAYSATAFTDGLMVMAGLAALVCAAHGWGGWAGVWLAISFASKQQGAFYLPLALALLAHHATPPPARRGAFARLGLALGGGVALLLVWDALRPGNSLFALASVNNDPQRLFPAPDEIPRRLLVWLGDLGALAGGAGVGLALGLLAGVGGWRAPRGVAWLAIFSAGYVALHTVLPFNLYDRYLLIVAPLLAILAGRGLARVAPPRRPVALAAALGICLMMALSPAQLPHDDRPRDDAVIRLAGWLNARPLGAILYDHWAGWHTGYYLGPWSDKRRVYYPDPLAFADDAPRNPERAPRYLIAPRDADARPWLDAIATAGWRSALAYRNGRWRVYRLTAG